MKNPTPDFGFDLLKELQELKLQFQRTGPVGRISFAKACIWSGINSPSEIISRVCAIAGEHLADAFEILLMEGENIHWRKCNNGSLELITDL